VLVDRRRSRLQALAGEIEQAGGSALAVPPRNRQARSTPGVRGEILAAINAITTRSGRPSFELNDVLVEMRRRGSTYAETTIRTMATSQMCANAPNNGPTTYTDLVRIGRGLYRLR
jgi:hypothetical protein